MAQFYNLTEYAPKTYDESDVYQIPFLINHDTVLSSFHEAVHGFVSYKDEMEVSQKIYDIYYQLEVMMQRKPDEARAIGKELIEKLLHIETDDDAFPIFQLQSLYELIGEEKSYEEVADLYLANMVNKICSSV